MKEQDKVTISPADDILIYGVYFIDSELPVAVFWDYQLVLAFCQYFTDGSVDKEIRSARMWDAAGPLFRDRTQFVERITVKNSKDEGLT